MGQKKRVIQKQHKTIHKTTPKTTHKRETRTAWMFILPSLIGISIFILIPFLDAVRRSFHEAMSKRFVGLDNYINVFTNEAFQLAAKNTGRFMLTCIPLLLALSLLLSILILQNRN